MNIIDHALQEIDRKRNQEAAILRAICAVDLKPEQRQRLLERLRSEGVLI